jgi:hypothetical protein
MRRPLVVWLDAVRGGDECEGEGEGQDVRNVVVDYLHKAIVTTVGLEIEGLRLDAGLLDELPLQVLLLEDRVGGVAGVFAHGVDGLRAILGFLGTGDIGQPACV